VQLPGHHLTRHLSFAASIPLATEQELSDFLKSVEKRAFKRSLYHVRNEESALDIVQDSMMKLAEHYGDKPPAELPMLFQRILSNCTLDWFRRQKTRNALFSNMSDFEGNADDGTAISTCWKPGMALKAGSRPKAPRTNAARPDPARDRIGDPGAAPTSTGGVSDALLGRNGCCRNGSRHGLLGRQRQNPLFPCHPGPEQGIEGQRNQAMNDPLFACTDTSARH
jgi:DNA-directed RNA polymerase specialized sigma24 family protein